MVEATTNQATTNRATTNRGWRLRRNPAGALAAGAYKVAWHMKTEDGHETDGTFAFTVK